MTTSLLKKFERLNVDIYASSTNASLAVAERIAAIIREKQSNNQNAVLGLATGSTPTRMYAELIRMHQEEGLSFKNVITFNILQHFTVNYSVVRYCDQIIVTHQFTGDASQYEKKVSRTK